MYLFIKRPREWEAGRTQFIGGGQKVSSLEGVNSTAFTQFWKTKHQKRDKTKEQTQKVFPLSAALKHALNFKYILKMLIKICLSAFLS